MPHHSDVTHALIIPFSPPAIAKTPPRVFPAHLDAKTAPTPYPHATIIPRLPAYPKWHGIGSDAQPPVSKKGLALTFGPLLFRNMRPTPNKRGAPRSKQTYFNQGFEMSNTCKFACRVCSVPCSSFG